MGNTEDETVLNGSPHIQYYANDTFNGNEHFQTEVLNNKENIAPIAISRKNSQKNHSPNSHLTFSVSSKYVFNSISKMGSPVAFDVWSKRRTK